MRCILQLLSALTAVILLAGPTTAAQVEAADAELAKVRSELEATRKELTEARRALEKSQAEQAATQARLAESTKAEETLRRELESEKAEHKTTAAKLTAAAKEAARTREDQAAAQAQLAETVKAAQALHKKLESENAQSIAVSAQLEAASKDAARTKEELVAAQKTLTDTALAKIQTELDTTQKKLAETQQALRKHQAELAEAVHGRETLDKDITAERARSMAAAAQLDLATKEAAQVKAQLAAAQQTLAKQPPLPATIVVTLPAAAKLTFDDRPTTSTGNRRAFVSPALGVGRIYYYTLKAEVMRDGKAVTVQKQVEVRAGERIEVTLTLPATESIGQHP